MTYKVKEKVEKFKLIRITELAEILGMDYRQLRTRIKNIEKKHNVRIISKADEELSKTPLYVDTDILYEIVPQLAPAKSAKEVELQFKQRIKELELHIQDLYNLMVIKGMIKSMPEEYKE